MFTENHKITTWLSKLIKQAKILLITDKALARIDEMKYGKDFHLVAAPKLVNEPTPKSRRAFWTDEEVQRLQELFQINPYPDQQAKRQLR